MKITKFSFKYLRSGDVTFFLKEIFLTFLIQNKTVYAINELKSDFQHNSTSRFIKLYICL